MIYIDKKTEEEKLFVKLLSDTKNDILGNFSVQIPARLSAIDFETLVAQKMARSARGSDFEGHVTQTGSHAFPDIVAKRFFGVEVKTTLADKWISTGNSVLETTRVDGVEKIYMFFAKFGSPFDIKYRRYQECLQDIGVTHSPRYKIDMNLELGCSIFDKMGIDYDALRQEQNPIRRIKDYYRDSLADGEELWWIDSQAEGGLGSPIIRPLRNLSDVEKRKFMVEAMVLFPEIFGVSTLKFERVAAYLVITRNVVSSNLRDLFTAGGKIDVRVNGETLKLPRIFGHLRSLAEEITRVIDDFDEATLAHYWRSPVARFRLGQWKSLLREHVLAKDGITAEDVFNSFFDENKNFQFVGQEFEPTS